MRRVTVWAPRGSRDRVVAAAGEHGANGTLVTEATAQDPAREVDVVVVHLPNGAVGDFVADLEEAIDDLHVSMLPQGVIALHPPAEEAPEQVVDVAMRHPLEIVLASLQSIGSWKSFLTYAGLSGAVVFVAFYTNTVFLLIGAMLISPLAEPVMNVAVGTARGAGPQVLRSLGRFFAALVTGGVVAAALSLVYGLDEPTSLMSDVSTPSLAAVLLPLAAGIAGGVNLVSSERSSLVSAAGPGLLIAASLAPPMGLVGMALVLGEPEILAASAFVLGLQLAGITIAAAVVFRLAGVTPTGMRYARGRPVVQRIAGAIAIVALAGLVVLQLAGSPNLRRESLERDAEAAAREAVSAMPALRPVTMQARFVREDIDGRRVVLVTGFAQRTQARDARGSQLEAAVARRVSAAVERRLPDATALVDITVAAP